MRFISTTLTIVRVPHGGVGGRIRRDLQAEQGGHYWGTLVESGIFSVVRHPIYSGLSLAAFGWSLIWNSIAALVATLLLLSFFDIKARREERCLEEKFPGYSAYKSRVKKLIPFVY